MRARCELLEIENSRLIEMGRHLGDRNRQLEGERDRLWAALEDTYDNVTWLTNEAKIFRSEAGMVLAALIKRVIESNMTAASE